MMHESKSTVLLVDDVPENLRVLGSILKANGFNCRSARGGKLALDAARRSPPDLILLDVMMPEMDGFSVCAALKTFPELKEIPVIFISALAEIGDKVKGLDCGAVDYITKPFEEAEVLARVRTHLELSQQRQQIRKNLAQLKKLESVRDTLVHMVVHDLKGPLSLAKGYIALMGMENLGGEPASYLKEINGALERMEGMVLDMLAVSKSETGSLDLHRDTFDLRQLIGELMVKMSRSGEGARIRIESSEPEYQVFADKLLTTRIIENLVGNARKFSHKNAEVIVRIQNHAGMARVEIIDQGPGIPLESQGRLFEKFSRLQNGHHLPGVGLGLAFCRTAVESHGGQIGVISELGKGSDFWFTIPLKSTPPPSINLQGAAHSEAG